MNGGELLFLSSKDVEHLLSVDDCIVAVEQAFLMHGQGNAVPPAVLSMHTGGGGFHIKAGLLELGRSYFAAKVNGNFPQNHVQFGLPTIQGVIVLSDAANGAPLAIIDSREITSRRTGAATAVAAKYLARKDARIVTVCGCGTQGRVQLEALARVCQIEKAFAYDTNSDQAAHFASELTSLLAIPVKVTTDLSSAVRGSDIIVTCTPSRRPLVFSEEVEPGTFVAAVGADNPSKQEIDPRLLAKSKVICDILEQCAAMGDLHHALEAGVLTTADVHAELGEIVAGGKSGRRSDEEIVIFDSTGMALQDVAASACLYEKANQCGAGVPIRFPA
jgi:alanine dehydrogenase